MPKALMIAIGFGAVVVCAPAHAQQDNGACAKIEEPLAYNACLARFGPHAFFGKGVGGEDEDFGGKRAPGDEDVSRRHGRTRLEFDLPGKRRP